MRGVQNETGVSQSAIQRLEAGKNQRISRPVVLALCDFYEITEGERATAQRLVAQTSHQAEQPPSGAWWHSYSDAFPDGFDRYVSLENRASLLVSYQPDIVPGLLQTDDYYRALIRAKSPHAPDHELERRVQIRMYRQEIVTRRISPVHLDVTIGEAALHRQVGQDRAVMAAQFRHLLAMTDRTNVTLRMLPFAAGFPEGRALNSFVIMHFPPAPAGQPPDRTVVYLELVAGDLVLEQKKDVAVYDQTAKGIQTLALNDVDTRRELRRFAKEYEQRARI